MGKALYHVNFMIVIQRMLESCAIQYEGVTIMRRMTDARITARLRPRGSRDELAGMRDGVLQAKVTAAPVDGKANAALCRLIAKRLGVARSRVGVIRGEKSREKLVRVEGVGQDRVEEALESGDDVG
jgi:hypothetical protein